MSTSITLHSFAELEDYRDLLENDNRSEAPVSLATQPDLSLPHGAHCDGTESPVNAPASMGDGQPDKSPQALCAIQEDVSDSLDELDVAALLARLEDASTTLAVVTRRDQEARAVALRDLECYDRLVAATEEAGRACACARQVRLNAGAFEEGAFSDEARASAQRVLALATEAEEQAARALTRRREEVDRLVEQLDLERLLTERQREEETAHALALSVERADRLAEAVATATIALADGLPAEARGALAPLCAETPNNAEVASLMETIARQELTAKVIDAEEALRLARREYRHHPFDAVTRLAALDVEGLPAGLASQVFGEWARACSRLCRERAIQAPLRYAPDAGRGAVLARYAGEGDYVVVSALGMGKTWLPGTSVDKHSVRRARPLR